MECVRNSDGRAWRLCRWSGERGVLESPVWLFDYFAGKRIKPRRRRLPLLPPLFVLSLRCACTCRSFLICYILDGTAICHSLLPFVVAAEMHLPRQARILLIAESATATSALSGRNEEMAVAVRSAHLVLLSRPQMLTNHEAKTVRSHCLGQHSPRIHQ